MAKLQKIWVKPGHGIPLKSLAEVDVVAGEGIVDNADQGGSRQVTMLSQEGWDAMNESLEGSVDPSVRRANFLVSGVSLEDSRGRVLVIGDVRILIAGETKPCRQMDEMHPGLQAAMAPHWYGGAYGEVLQGGTVRIEDPVSWLQ